MKGNFVVGINESIENTYHILILLNKLLLVVNHGASKRPGLIRSVIFPTD